MNDILRNTESRNKMFQYRELESVSKRNVGLHNNDLEEERKQTDT